MDIGFNLAGCGLGNNGGSQTIIRMAEALKARGHNAMILSDKKCNFTWFDFDKSILCDIDKDASKWPDLDFIIATGCSTVKSTHEYGKIDINKKFYWIRGIETWAMSEEDLFKGYSSGLRLLVNSEWQRKYLFMKYGLQSRIQYSGLPIGEISEMAVDYSELSLKRTNDKINLGFLYSNKQQKDSGMAFKIINILISNNLLNKIYILSNEEVPSHSFMRYVDTEVYLQPSMKDKVEMMCNCDIWLGVSFNEGMHIPPAEAGLCGCNLVVRGLDPCGVSDYCIDGYTSKVYFTVDEAMICVREYIENKNMRTDHLLNLLALLKYKIGDVETNAERLEDILISDN